MSKKLKPVIESIEAILEHCGHEEKLRIHVHRLRAYARNYRDREETITAYDVRVDHNQALSRPGRDKLAV